MHSQLDSTTIQVSDQKQKKKQMKKREMSRGHKDGRRMNLFFAVINFFIAMSSHTQQLCCFK